MFTASQAMCDESPVGVVIIFDFAKFLEAEVNANIFLCLIFRSLLSFQAYISWLANCLLPLS